MFATSPAKACERKDSAKNVYESVNRKIGRFFAHIFVSFPKVHLKVVAFPKTYNVPARIEFHP